MGDGGGHQPLNLEQKPIIWQDVCQNCMKIKEIGPTYLEPPPPIPPRIRQWSRDGKACHSYQMVKII